MNNKTPFFYTHNWWGKILGGFFGYLIGHSIGALIGILIGNFFDRAFAAHLKNPFNPFVIKREDLLDPFFFKAIFSVMGYVAKSDGQVSPREIAKAEQIMNDMRLNIEQKKIAQSYFNEGKNISFDVSTVLSPLALLCQKRPLLLKLFIDTVYNFSQTDPLTQPKIQAMNIILQRLGFAKLNEQYRFYEDFAEHVFRRSGQAGQDNYTTIPGTSLLDEAYALLNIKPTASQAEIKKAYRRLMSHNHPDKLIAKGLPEALIKQANEKTQKITKAYELICKSRGF